jgi:hypothetical protein
MSGVVMVHVLAGALEQLLVVCGLKMLAALAVECPHALFLLLRWQIAPY